MRTEGGDGPPPLTLRSGRGEKTNSGNAGEIEAPHRAGMIPMQALQAATRAGAELLGWQDRIGTVEPGKLADLIAVPGNPLEDLTALRRVSFVLLGGKIVRGGRVVR